MRCGGPEARLVGVGDYIFREPYDRDGHYIINLLPHFPRATTTHRVTDPFFGGAVVSGVWDVCGCRLLEVY